MCGIAGQFLFEGAPADRDLVSRMGESLAHRGPDEEGFYFAPGVGFAHRRLSMIDLAQGKQPMTNEDQSLWMICNGEIYNFVELRESLEARGHRFSTQCDVEVILHLFEERGVESFNEQSSKPDKTIIQKVEGRVLGFLKHARDTFKPPTFRTLISIAGLSLGFLSKGTLLQILAFIVLLLVGCGYLFHRSKPSFYFLSVLTILSILFVGWGVDATLFWISYRYASGYFPFLCVFAAASINFCFVSRDTHRFFSRRTLPVLTIVGSLYYLLAGLYVITYQPAQVFDFQPWNRIATHLNEHSDSSDLIIGDGNAAEILEIIWSQSRPVKKIRWKRSTKHVRKFLKRAKQKNKAVWIILVSTQNSNSLIQRFTGHELLSTNLRLKQLERYTAFNPDTKVLVFENLILAYVKP